MTRRQTPAEAVSGRIEGLDGIRAFAVIAVVIFHLWPDRLPGGFLGVDVFFVISGFLITTLLLREHKRDGRIDLVGFWKRRARRLLPALITVVVVSIGVASVVSDDLVVGIERQTLGAMTFSSNWLEVMAGADYFDDSSPTLFVTFWSLAVEEQFYLLWPVVFLGLIAIVRKPVHRMRVAGVLALASAAWMAALFSPGSNPTRVYYGTDTHLFGLMLGAGLAFAFAGNVGLLAQRRWQRLRLWTGFVSLLGLAVLMVTIDSSGTATYRGGLLLASLLSAVAVACLPGRASAYTTMNRLAPLAWIGERSYGIYLWHWPVILVVTALLPAAAPGADPSFVKVGVSLAVTAVLAEASFRWIETPVRRDGFRATFASLLALLRPGRVDRGPAVRAASLGAVAAAALVVLAGVGLATAPEKSEAQLAVERGQQAIEEQSPASGSEGTPGTPSGDESAAPGAGEGVGATTPTEVGPIVETPDAPSDVPISDAGDSGVTPTDPPPGSTSPAWPVDQPVPPGDAIIGFGDSVLTGAAPAVYDRFPGVLLDAKPIRQWRDAPEFVQAHIDAGTMRDVVVLNYGTNAGLMSDEAEDGLRKTLDAIGPSRRVVLVNIVGVSRWVPSSNEKLAQISAEYPNTIVADWHSLVKADPSLVHTDKTHPNMKGIKVYADLLARSLETLGPA